MSSIFEKFGIKKQKQKDSSKSSKTKGKVSDSDKKKTSSKNKVAQDKEKTGKKTKAPKSQERLKKSKKSSKAKKSKFKKSKKKAFQAYRFILEVMDTEKSLNQKQNGKYTFRVNKKANKNQIKEAIQDYYSVEVDNVNIINYKPKKKRFGLTWGKRISWKKAIITLKKGYSINS
ncbi:MAG: 50S ribosomal protein L23 [Candidatus Moranbacteria bacterium]|nr:50S ribosomal protein L23 [Candidatus Moranbacteria bacterium]